MIDVFKLLQQIERDGRRLDRRFAYQQSIHYRIDKGPFQRARLEDVSDGGLRMTIPRYVPKGAKLQILYNQPLSSRQYWVEGQVRWSREIEASYSTGVELHFQSDSDEKPFRSMVQQLATAC